MSPNRFTKDGWPDPVISENSIALKTQDDAGLLSRTFGNVQSPFVGELHVVLRPIQE